MVKGAVGSLVASSPATAESSRGGSQCLVRGEKVTLEQVTVRPRATKPFTVGLRGVVAVARLPRSIDAEVELSLDGPVSFRAHSRNVWLTVVRDDVSPDGLVEVRRGSRVVHGWAKGEAVIASAVMYADDVLEGEDKEPDEMVSSVRLPCELVALGSVEVSDGPDESDATTPPAEGAHAWWEPKHRSSRVALLRRPRSTASPIVITSSHCEGCLLFRELRQDGSWMFVERTGEGVTIKGWVRRAEFVRAPDDVGVGRSYGCHGDHGGGGWGEGWSPTGRPANLDEGEALIGAGAKVFASPAVGEWGVFTEQSAVRVRYFVKAKT